LVSGQRPRHLCALSSSWSSDQIFPALGAPPSRLVSHPPPWLRVWPAKNVIRLESSEAYARSASFACEACAKHASREGQDDLERLCLHRCQKMQRWLLHLLGADARNHRQMLRCHSSHRCSTRCRRALQDPHQEALIGLLATIVRQIAGGAVPLFSAATTLHAFHSSALTTV